MNRSVKAGIKSKVKRKKRFTKTKRYTRLAAQVYHKKSQN